MAASEALAGHSAGVVGAEVDATGGTFVTVSRDHSILSWRMGPDGAPPTGARTTRPGG